MTVLISSTRAVLVIFDQALSVAARASVASAETPRFGVGCTYLAAIALFDGRDWAVLGSGAAMPFEDDRTGSGEWSGRPTSITEHARSALFALYGKSAAEIQDIVTRIASPAPRTHSG